ncbi:hypothetical protein [Labilibaculum manganireducens]|uniref:hypothetical protein n=1 Tax=Labilibaculum manganireducens TaxID=1940525 RepID=UPI0029F4D8C4|nr:hypothetical protein [Labilibaculum manganireducens]
MKLNFFTKLLISLLFNILCISSFVLADDYEEGSVRYFDDFTQDQVYTNVQLETISAVPDESPNRWDLILDKVVCENRITSSLKEDSFFSLPIGISSGASSSYMIVIDEASVYADHAEFSAFMVLTNPLDGTKIRFRAKDIAFSFESGLLNGMKLELMDTKKSKIMKDTYLNWLPGCFVEWDCNGFKSLGINGSIELNEKSYVAVNPTNGEETGIVVAPIYATGSDFQNILVEFSLPTFKKKGFDETFFSFTSVVLDLSDTDNAPGFKFPDNYPGGFNGEMKNLWQGFYVKDATITLAKKFNDKSGQMTSFFASDLLLDDFGLTGHLGVENLISIENGRLGAWPMSISKLELDFFTGEFKSFGIDGSVIVQGSKTEMKYTAFFDSEGIYHFGVNPGKGLKFDVFAAEVILDENSRIEVTVDHGKFLPTAILNGNISFACSKKAGGESKMLKLPNLDFQGMRISSVAPAFDLEYMGMSSKEELSFNKFPVTLTEAAYQKVNQGVGKFIFGIKINLSGDSFVGETVVGIIADMSGTTWKFNGLDIKKIYIKAEKEGAYTVEGTILIADNDPNYGDGFRGDVKASFNSFEVSAVAVFGKVDGFRYFFVDGFVCLPPPGTPTGPFILQGFGGGLYYKMKQAGPNGIHSEMGESLSGITYVPDKSSSLGIKAGIKAGIVNETLVNCTASFEIIFNNHGGINQIGFVGEAKFVSPMEALSIEVMKETASGAAMNVKIPIPLDEVLRAKIKILIDFQNSSFHSEMEVFVNVAGVLTGIGAENRAGYGIIHVDPDKWYLHMGTPTDPVGLNFIGFMKVGGYFMAGHDIPDTMVMNPKVLEYLDINQAKLDGNRQEGTLAMGKGLAFGAHFSLDTGDLKFLIFYARFELGGGFDIMLLDYGKNAYCLGRNGNLGMNGWYAKGQAYAYFGGKIGIRVKVFGRRKKFDIIDIRTAAAIRVEGPNPTFMWGAVGGSYRILGGLIKGKCKFEMTVGEKCNIQTNPKELSDLEIIADLSPMHDASKVDVFTLPQAVFNMPVDKELKISEDNKLTKVFKINLKEYSLYKDGAKLGGQIEWDGEHTTLAFTPDMMFYPHSKYKIVAKVSFDEKINGVWQEYKDDSGKVYIETKEAEFTTGELPERIPENYISYTYPIDKQVHFYKNEYSLAYVTFKSDLTPFFVPVDGWVKKVKWTPVNGVGFYSDLSYNPSNKSVEINGAEKLNLATVYRLDLVNTPVDDNSSVNRNVSESTKTEIAEGENIADITTREATGTISNVDEKAFFGLDFRTSKFNKFLDKVNKNELSVLYIHYVRPAVDFPVGRFSGDEMFDGYEIHGKGDVEALIQREAVLETADWYLENIYPLMYDEYPLHSRAKILNRNISLLGLPPTKTIDIWQTNDTYLLNETDVATGQIRMHDNVSQFVYTLPNLWARDYYDIRNGLANLVADGYTPNAKMNAILLKYPWPQVSAGNYPIKLEYVLPGRKIVTSTRVINLKNEFKTRQINLLDVEF